MDAQITCGIFSGGSALLSRRYVTAFLPAFFLYFIFSLFPGAIIAETKYSNLPEQNYLTSGIKLRDFYRMVYFSNTAERKVLLQKTPDEVIMQYAENRLALFNSTMDKDPSGRLCFSFIYPQGADNGAAITFLPAKKTEPVLSRAETDTLYISIFLRLRHTYGGLLDEEEAETLKKDAVLACEIKSALYQSVLQLSPQDAAGVLRYIWGKDGIF